MMPTMDRAVFFDEHGFDWRASKRSMADNRAIVMNCIFIELLHTYVETCVGAVAQIDVERKAIHGLWNNRLESR